jgi:uncharacterized protein (DUF433 family)
MLQSSRQSPELSLVGVGLYTPAEAAQLTGIKSTKIVRWLRGHSIGNHVYEPLWSPQIDIGDGRTYLGFLDLIQARVAAAFIDQGLSPQKVRSAIKLAHQVVQSDYPFANARFRTDGKTIVLEVLRIGEDDRLIDLFRSGQYVMKKVIEPSLKGIEFEHDLATRWWPIGKAAGVVIDPRRQFGQPVDAVSGIPTAVLAEAAVTEGSIDKAAKVYSIAAASIKRALAFEQKLAV